MMLHTFRKKQFIKSDPDTVWRFISSPENLALITPSYMGFRIISDKDDLETMYPGQIIEYYVSPLAGIRMHWVTEITQVDQMRYFVDEQRQGPYKLWHHQHFIRETDGGVEMTDIVHYKLPFGIIGRLVNTFLVRHQLKKIFDFRFQKIGETFNGTI